jgi:SAM-dependent methyltransferase
MRNSGEWGPTKYVRKDGRLVPSRDEREVAAASRLSAGLVAEFYGRYLEQHARGRLLDLGCGKVPLYGAYRGCVTDAICVDWPNTLHGSARHIDAFCDISKPLPFQDGVFDTVILSSVLEHISDPETLWREMARVLAEGGKVIANSPFFYAIHEAPNDYYRYTQHALVRFAERSGFGMVCIEATGGAPEVLADVFAKWVAGTGRIGRMAGDVVQWLAFWSRTTLRGRRVSDKTKARFPMSYFFVAERLRDAKTPAAESRGEDIG